MDPINLNEYGTHIRVRQLERGDFSRVVELQEICFPGQSPWTEAEFAGQVATFPEGQLGVEADGILVAVSSSLILDFDIYGFEHTYDEITARGTISNHNPEGDTLYGIDIMVHPDYRGQKLARRLYDARKELVLQLNLMRIVIGGRVPGYHEHKDELSVREYVQQVLSRAIYDPVLTTQLSNGFIIKRIIGNYLEEDRESAGYAILMEWPNIDYMPDSAKVYRSSRPVRISAIQYKMRAINSFDEFAGQCEYFVDTASEYKADFILFPELLTTQLLSFVEEKHPGQAARKLAEFTPDYLDLFNRLAVEYNINIIGGSHFTLEGEKLYNAAYLFQRSGEINRQVKLHNTPDERDWWGLSPGNKVEVFDTDRGRIAILICYDIEFPEVVRIAVEKGARILFVPFCTDERHGYWRVRYCAQARCIENQVYAVIAGTVGNLPKVENMAIQYAQSAILTPSDFMFARDGIAAECTPNIETLVVHDVDLEMLKRSRKSGTTRNWLDRRHDLYQLTELESSGGDREVLPPVVRSPQTGESDWNTETD
ncbi:GNAT family N-acetyltransferase [bacterium]|nr:GNAT family N-acetyltransferase [bacterium]